jgi:hypothetical protein
MATNQNMPFFARTRAAVYWKWRALSAKPHPQPIFIGGNQKSGTTAVGALLAKAVNGSFTNDIFYRCKGAEAKLLSGDWDFPRVRRKLAYCFEAEIIKDPSLFFIRDQVSAVYPTSKWVFVIRDPRANIRSLLNRLKIPGDLSDLESSHWAAIRQTPGWLPVFEGTGLGGCGNGYIETLARRWLKGAEALKQYQDSSICVRYEDFCAAKDQTIEDLARQLGFTHIQSIRQYADTDFQPRGDRSAQPIDFFGESNLKKIESICQPMMEAFGYTTVRD